MTSTISGFWHSAARLSGQVDWSAAIRTHGGHLEHMTADERSRSGIAPRHQHLLKQSNPLNIRSGVLFIDQPTYPPALRHLPYAPAVLFYEGNAALLSERCISIVGARKCTQRAKDLTRALASSLAASDSVIVSGLAYGVDHAVHLACLSRTIAVLGQGIDQAYKGSKVRTIERIIDAGGLVLSEFPPYQTAGKHTFPQRNRVIAGLSIATIVVEASMRSGSRITARLALEYGREVMAVPGHPFETQSKGCNQLISDGALLIRDANDVRNALGIHTPRDCLPAPETTVARQILSALDSTITMDELLEKTGIPMSTLLSAIESLELTGWIQRLPGDRIHARISQ